MSDKFADKRTGAGHIKQGFKAVKETYKALYNNKTAGAKTGANNLKAVVTGRTADGKVVPKAARAKVGALGAASVTPIGPIAAFAMGVKKSVKEAKDDRAKAAVVKAMKKELKAMDAGAPAPGAPKLAATFKKAAPSAGLQRTMASPTIGEKLPPAPPPPKVRPTVMRPAALPKASSLKLPPAPPRPTGKGK